MEINEKNIKLWSTLGPRATLGLAINDYAKDNENFMVLTSDVSTSAGLDRFKKNYPEKYIDVGIAEQNLMGIAAGIASEKFKVLTTTFAPFQTMRCNEQIKVNLGYMKNKVCMIGIASGLILGNLGYTHCCIEDVGALRSIPNLKIISPADSLETIKALESTLNNLDTSVYIRLTGGSNNPIVYNTDYVFDIGKSIKLVDGSDITIISCGSMVYNAIEVSKLLKKQNISCSVINMHTIKPIDKVAIKDACNAKLVVTIEEHNVIGGLGSAVAEELSKYKNKSKFLPIGIQGQYTGGGDYKFLLRKHDLDIEGIFNKIIENYKTT